LALRRSRSTAWPLSAPVWNICTRPADPRASMFIRKPTRRARGSRWKKALAPSKPASSPSVITSMTSRAGTPLALRARTVSSAAATPAASSADPGEPGTLS
jgi:hypothetical protein